MAWPLCAPVHWAAGSDREMNFGVTRDAAPKAASSSVARYSRAARQALSLTSSGFHSSLGTERCLFASAAIRLASTANPSAPTSPSAMPRATMVSNRWRKTLLSRKRPCRFLEKVEWSGTLSKPAIGEIEMNLLAQSALRAYAHAIAGDQHADHQLRIDRGATGAAVEWLQRLTNVIEVEMPTDASQNVIGRTWSSRQKS